MFINFMNKNIFSFFSLAFILALSTGCSTTAEKELVEIETSETEIVVMHNYPTRDRVEYVFNCIAKHKADLYDYVPRYNCGCKIDKIAEVLTFEEFEAAITFTMLHSTPGENGAVFRDPKQSKNLQKRLKQAEANAEASCFI